MILRSGPPVDEVDVVHDTAVVDRDDLDMPTVTIRLSEIVVHREVDLVRSKAYLAELHAGHTLAPIEIDSEYIEHWSADGANYLGMGYALLEGHERYAALTAFKGANAETEVVMQGLQPMRGWRMGRP